MKLKIPWFSFSTVVFLLIIIFMSDYNLIPSPIELFNILEHLYQVVGFPGLFVASFLEGLAYVGLYFPGGTFIFISIVLTENSIISILTVALIVTAGITLSSFVNYGIGRHLGKNKIKTSSLRKKGGKYFYLAALNPSTLGIYFLYQGYKRKNFHQLFYVPLFLLPYGFLLAYIFKTSATYLKENVLSEWSIFLTVFVIWFIVELVLKNKESFKRGIQIIYKYLFD